MKNPIKDKTFVITGETDTERDELKAEVMAYGGRVTIAPSGKTDYLVVGQTPGESKLSKCEKLQITKITEEELLSMLEQAKKGASVDDVEFGEVTGLHSHEIEELEPIKTKKAKLQKKREMQTELWVEKYRPKRIEDFCGNKAALERLTEFLKTPIQDLERKAILLCGVPGIGKTTAAQLVCNILGKSFLEFNASDVRNKNSIKEISSIGRTLNFKNNKTEQSVIIMDEIDGISDRGGLPEMINFIKNTKVHIICMANEKSMKLKTLLNYVDEIHFRRLELRQIQNRIKEILDLEGITINEITLNKLLLKGHGDFRFILNQLQTFASGHLSLEATKIESKSVFETVMEIFHSNDISNKLDSFFDDPDLVPLLIQENYIKPPAFGTKPTIKTYFETAKQLSSGEYNNFLKGKTQNYTFGYIQAYWTTRVSHKIGRCDFSSWLGQTSKRNKNWRLIRELNYHNGARIELNSNETYRNFNLPRIYDQIMTFIDEKKTGECIEYLKGLGFVREDLDTLTIVLDKRLTDGRALKLACNKNPWGFSYIDLS
ncbi:Replication factor C subunit 1 [Cucumispora dikerogammari]|nr:Replication factor C subunit 1 [Cucumispora dikerogammari]